MMFTIMPNKMREKEIKEKKENKNAVHLAQQAAAVKYNQDHFQSV